MKMKRSTLYVRGLLATNFFAEITTDVNRQTRVICGRPGWVTVDREDTGRRGCDCFDRSG